MPDFPFDVILQIICRLPVKSLCRFKCVCKSWHAAIHERKFFEMHSEIIEIYHEKDSDGLYRELMWDANDGLLLVENTLRKDYHLRNPVTRERITIPRPHRLVKHIRFSYIQSTGGYKLIHAYCKNGTENGGCKVAIVGSDFEWRSLDIPSLGSLGYEREKTHSIVIEEVFYLSRYFTIDSHLSEIVYIEMGAADRYGVIKFPQELLRDWTNVGLVQWEDKLAVANLVNHEELLHLWVLENYKWAEKKIVVSLSFLRDIPLPENSQLWYHITGGWLQYAQGEHYVKFHIESNKLLVTECTSSGKVLAGYIRSSINVNLPVNRKQKIE